MDLPTFLLTARCWRILPMSTKGGKVRRQRARITYVKNDEQANNIVQHLHTSIQLLNHDIVNEEHLYMSSHRMDSVNVPKKFNILQQSKNKAIDEVCMLSLSIFSVSNKTLTWHVYLLTHLILQFFFYD